jgi:hypothetical protein
MEEVQMEMVRHNRRLMAVLVAIGAAVAAMVIIPVAYAVTTPTGFVKICKAASGPGVTGSFQFKVQGVATPVAVPVGGCSKSIKVASGRVTVTEVEQVDFDVVAVGTDPVGRVVSANLAARKATVKVPAGSVKSQTVVTFTNKLVPKGFVQVCKKAASGDSLTGTFAFAIAAGGTTTSTTVAVGACSASIRVPAGQATVTEAAKTTAAVSAIDVAPADRAVSSSVPNRTATVKVVAGAASTQTVVTFTNKTVPPPTGTLRVCKVAGPGVSTGQEFSFTVGTATTTAKAGSCSAPLTLPTGNVTVTEKVPAGFAATAIAVTGAGSLVSSNVGTATAVVKVAVGATDVSFTDKTVPTGCVRSKGFYRNHPDGVKALVTRNGGTLLIGGVALTSAQIGAILDRSSTNFLNEVSQQLITARLNQLSGASTTAAVQAGIDAAQALVKQQGGPLTGTATPTTKVVVGGVTYTASQVVGILGAYNEGTAAGAPGACS